MTTIAQDLPIEIPPGVSAREGLYACARCGQVAQPTQREIDAAENAPAGSKVELKCVHCRHWTVHWHPPSPDRSRREPRTVDQARGNELFRAMYAVVNNGEVGE